MVVDTSIKVRIFNNGQPEFKGIAVSEQDNSLGSLFLNDEISYTIIKVDRWKEFSDKENELLNLSESEEEEMLAFSKIDNARIFCQLLIRFIESYITKKQGFK